MGEEVIELNEILSLFEVYKLRTTMPVVSDYWHNQFVDRVYEQRGGIITSALL